MEIKNNNKNPKRKKRKKYFKISHGIKINVTPVMPFVCVYICICIYIF